LCDQNREKARRSDEARSQTSEELKEALQMQEIIKGMMDTTVSGLKEKIIQYEL
jgi:hypothetical protein